MSGSSAASAAALVHALLARGVRDVVLCPGSRSAPLAYALEAAERAGRVRLHVRHDERTAAFVALGCAAADPSVPAAVVTTSGTAVANLHPAVMEAHHAGLPLLLLTADRPASLRGTWANQTTELQPEVFGRATRRTVVVEAGEVGDWAALADEVVAAATGAAGRPGPVHLDLGYDEPLVPAADDLVPPDPLPRPPVRERPTREATLLEQGPRTLVVAGAGAGPGARTLAEQAGWPLLAEPSSGAKGGPHRVGAYRLLLENPSLADDVERVVVLGRPTLSRPVTRLLARDDVELVQVVAHADDVGPDREVRRVVGAVDRTARGRRHLAAPVDGGRTARRAGGRRRAGRAHGPVRPLARAPDRPRDRAGRRPGGRVVEPRARPRPGGTAAGRRPGAGQPRPGGHRRHRLDRRRGRRRVGPPPPGCWWATWRRCTTSAGWWCRRRSGRGCACRWSSWTTTAVASSVCSSTPGTPRPSSGSSGRRTAPTWRRRRAGSASRRRAQPAAREVVATTTAVPQGISVLVVPADRSGLASLHEELRAAVRAAGPGAT